MRRAAAWPIVCSSELLLGSMLVVLLTLFPSTGRAQTCEICELIPQGAALPAGATGAWYDQIFTVCGLHTGIITWLVPGNLPPGLTWDPHFDEPFPLRCTCLVDQSPDARLSGYPTVPGSYTFTVEAVDQCSDTVMRTYTLVVEAGCALAVTGSPGPAEEGTPYAALLGGSGGVPPYTFDLFEGSLPPGLVLSSGGSISGTPTQVGSWPFVVRIVDATSCGAIAGLTIAVSCPDIRMDPPLLPRAAVGAPYEIALATPVGTPPYAYTLTGGALPPGLSLSPAGLLFGTPGSPGSSSFAVSVTDGAGCTGLQDFSLDVMAAPDLVATMGLGAPNPSLVRVFDPLGSVAIELIAYGAGFGVEAAPGDLDHSFRDEIVTGPGPGPVLGPHVRAFDDGVPLPAVSFFAYATLRFGVHPATLDIEGDGRYEIVTGAGSGEVFGPHVRGFRIDAGVTPIAGISYFAYGTLKYGVQVAGGDLDGEGGAELATGPGPGVSFSANVRGWLYDGLSVRSLPGATFDALPAAGDGARVLVAGLDTRPGDEIVAGAGPGPTESARLRGFSYDGRVDWLPGFDVTLPGTLYGASVGGGDPDRDGRRDVIVGAGPDPLAPSTVRAFTYQDASLWMVGRWEAFPGAAYGVGASSGYLGR